MALSPTIDPNATYGHIDERGGYGDDDDHGFFYGNPDLPPDLESASAYVFDDVLI